jgi:hypothetical protein
MDCGHVEQGSVTQGGAPQGNAHGRELQRRIREWEQHVRSNGIGGARANANTHTAAARMGQRRIGASTIAARSRVGGGTGGGGACVVGDGSGGQAAAAGGRRQ